MHINKKKSTCENFRFHYGKDRLGNSTTNVSKMITIVARLIARQDDQLMDPQPGAALLLRPMSAHDNRRSVKKRRSASHSFVLQNTIVQGNTDITAK